MNSACESYPREAYEQLSIDFNGVAENSEADVQDVLVPEILVKAQSLIGFLTKFMGLAEDVISSMKRKRPEHAQEIHGSFKYLCPSDILTMNGSDLLYEKHCEEIIERVIEGRDVDEATKAEVLGTLVQSSLKGMLNGGCCFLYATIFEELFPGKSPEGCESYREDYPGQAGEILYTFKRRLRTQRLCLDQEERRR
ncbi:MAG TPA: hypothetical protein PLV96_00360 [Methanoregulaceae archaeon]|nr:hypothetical protein [Methanoregulaceae archaeon]